MRKSQSKAYLFRRDTCTNFIPAVHGHGVKDKLKVYSFDGNICLSHVNWNLSFSKQSYVGGEEGGGGGRGIRGMGQIVALILLYQY